MGGICRNETQQIKRNNNDNGEDYIYFHLYILSLTISIGLVMLQLIDMRAAIKNLKQNEFFRNNFVLFVGSLLVAFLNYLYYPVLGRLLSVESFGEVQVILSFFTQLTVFLSAFMLITTNIVVNEPNKKVANQAVTELSRAALYASLVILVLISALAIPLQNALKFDSPVAFILLGIIFTIGVATAFQAAYLRAKKDFVATSLQGVYNALGKIIFSALFVILGFQTAGAIGGVVAAQVVALIYVFYRAKKLGYEKVSQSTRGINWELIKQYLPYSLFVFLVTLVLTLLYSFDTVIIKYLFSPEIAGQYAGVSTIARIILFVTGSFAIVLLSSVKVSAPAKDNVSQLTRSVVVTLLLGGGATLFFSLFPVFITHLLFGERYDSMAHLLPYISFTMLFISLATLLANYHIALRHYWVLLHVGFGVLTGVVLLSLFHATVNDIVISIFYSSAALLASLGAWTSYTIYKEFKQQRSVDAT